MSYSTNKRFDSLLRKMGKIRDKKAHDYSRSNAGSALGNFQLSGTIFGIDPALTIGIRMSDKLSRVGSLLQKKKSRVDESLEDTLLDLANYSLLMILQMKEKRWKSS